MKACNAYSKLTLPETPMLFLEFHGTEAGVAEQSERFGEIANGPRRRSVHMDHQDRGAHQAVAGAPRRLLGGARTAARRDGRSRPTSACRSRGSPNASPRPRRDIAERRPDRADRRPCRRRQFPLLAADRHGQPGGGRRPRKAFNARLVERAIAMEGTCTGEHGVGQGKMKYLKAEHGEALAVMRVDQAGARPARPHESGKNRRNLIELNAQRHIFAALSAIGSNQSGRARRFPGHRTTEGARSTLCRRPCSELR